LKGRARVLCLSRDRKPLTGDHTRDIFNRGFAKSRMWAQYSENHGGVCLVFDREKLAQRIHGSVSAKCPILAGPVRYRNNDSLSWGGPEPYTIDVYAMERLGLRAYAGLHLRQFHPQLFFEKLEDWRDEDEFRFVVWGRGTDDIYIKYGDALKGVIFGENVRAVEVEKAKALLPDEVEWQGLKWLNCSPWFDFGNPLFYARRPKVAKAAVG